MGEVVTITNAAREYLIKKLEHLNKPFLLFGLKGGGCAGFEYYWEPVDATTVLDNNDEIIALDKNYKYRLIIGYESVMYLLGSTIDYVEEITGNRLVVENPNAKGGCGCGSSISV